LVRHALARTGSPRIRPATVVSAADANEAGERYATLHAEIAAPTGVPFERLRPTDRRHRLVRRHEAGEGATNRDGAWDPATVLAHGKQQRRIDALLRGETHVDWAQRVQGDGQSA